MTIIEDQSRCTAGNHLVPGDQIAGVGAGKNGKDVWFCNAKDCQKKATKQLIGNQAHELAEILAKRDAEITRPPDTISTRQIPF